MITKEQWLSIEEELSAIYVNVKFEYNGFELAIQRGRSSESKTVLSVHINGHIKPSWAFIEDECDDRPEIIEHVWKTATRAKYTGKSIKNIEKVLGKRRAKAEYPDLHDRQEYFLPFFPKASVLCRQFKKLVGITLTKASCLDN